MSSSWETLVILQFVIVISEIVAPFLCFKKLGLKLDNPWQTTKITKIVVSIVDAVHGIRIDDKKKDAGAINKPYSGQKIVGFRVSADDR
jgi:hypothetical protein